MTHEGKNALSAPLFRGVVGKNYGNSAKSLDIHRVCDLLDKNAFAEVASICQTAHEDARDSFTALKHEIACFGYYLADRVHEDDDAWKIFRDDDFWTGHSKLNRRHCLRYALMYIYGSHQGQRAEVARDHARALNGLWTSGASAKEVHERLREVGFRGMFTKKNGRLREIEPSAKKQLKSRTFKVRTRADKRIERFVPGRKYGATILVRQGPSGRSEAIIIRVRPVVEEKGEIGWRRGHRGRAAKTTRRHR